MRAIHPLRDTNGFNPPDNAEPDMTKSKIIILQFIFFICCLVYLTLCLLDNSTLIQSLYFISLLQVAYFFWGAYSWYKVTRRLFDPYFLFLVTAFLFNAGDALLRVCFIPINDHKYFIRMGHSDDILLKTSLLTFISLISFHFGGLLSTLYSSPHMMKEKHVQDPQSIAQNKNVCRRIGLGFILISIGPLIYLLHILLLVATSFGYSMVFNLDAEGQIPQLPRLLAQFFMPGVLFFLVGSKGRPISEGISILFAIIYAGIYFIIGSRSTAAMPLAAFAWVWHSSIRPIRKNILILSGILLLFIVFPVIGIIRLKGFSSTSIANFIDAFLSLDNPVIAILDEMGSTSATISWTIDIVPATHDYYKGLTYLFAIFSTFPNIFWSAHPAIAWSPARMLVARIAPDAAALGCGFGYSFIAEAYLNFGWIFSQFFLIFLGYLLGRLTDWGTRQRNPARIAAMGSFTCFFLFAARGDSFLLARPLFWYTLFPYALTVFLSPRNKQIRHVAAVKPLSR
jgi:oligosaccharide repeat unit polymerase